MGVSAKFAGHIGCIGFEFEVDFCNGFVCGESWMFGVGSPGCLVMVMKRNPL